MQFTFLSAERRIPQCGTSVDFPRCDDRGVPTSNG
jgi:hypothetical protein